MRGYKLQATDISSYNREKRYAELKDALIYSLHMDSEDGLGYMGLWSEILSDLPLQDRLKHALVLGSNLPHIKENLEVFDLRNM